MGRSHRDRFPPDRMLQLRMAAVLLVALPWTALVLAFVVWCWTVRWELGLFVTVIMMMGQRAQRRKPLRASELGRVTPILERLSAVAGITPPRAKVLPGEVPLSWTTALPARRPTISLTKAMVDVCSDDDLEVVLAHELGHLLHGDAWVMTVGGGPPSWMLAGSAVLLEDGDGKSLFAFLIFGLVPSILSIPGALAARILSRQRELSADRAAAMLTGSPAQVAATLLRLSGTLARIPSWDLRAVRRDDTFHFLPTRHTEPRSLCGRMWATHPPIARRVAQLEAMEARLQRPRA